MNPAKHRERKCSTCKHYQPSPLWRKGWCRNPLLYDRNTNHLVEADSLACNRTFIDYWEPMTGPMPSAGPQARSSKPRIAPSIPMDTMDAQGRHMIVTGNNTPASGMAAVAPRGKGRKKEIKDIPERPALALVTPEFDEVFGEDAAGTMDPAATLQLEEVKRPTNGVGRTENGTSPQAVKKQKEPQQTARTQKVQRRGVRGLWADTRTRIGLLVALVALLLGGGVGAWYLNKNNTKALVTPTATVTVLAVLPTPTGFGDPTATVPAVPTQPVAPPPTDKIAVNGWVQVGGTNSGLVVRDAPTRQGKRLGLMPDGTKAHVVDGPQQADGFTWWKVTGYSTKDPAASGWCAAQFLTPIPAPVP